VASLLVVERDDILIAVATAMLMYEIAAERAAKRPDVKGPGSFVPAFIDELYHIRQESIEGNGAWAQAAQIDVV
jgi:thiamine-phosphate diphosphorylase/hydroxyethylthiazole kinase